MKDGVKPKISIYSLPALLTPFPEIPFITEEIIGCTNEAATGANAAPRNSPSCFVFHVLLFQKHHQLIHPNPLVIL